MDYKEIKRLMDDMGNSKLDSLDIEFPDGIKIKMKKNTQKEVIITAPQSNVIEAGAPMTAPVKVEKQEQALTTVKKEPVEEENYKIVKSPMVGTFYASPAPDKPPFVSVGDKVHKGQVLCVIEAMKLMNEIESEYDGEVVEILAKDDDMVEYGQVLIKIK